MSRPTPEDEERLNPKIATSVFDLLLIELVPLAYRITADLHAREEALLATFSHLSTTTTTQKTLPDRTSLVSASTAEREIGSSSGEKGVSSSGIPGTEGADAESEDTREAVFYKLDNLGYRVGQGLVERFSADQPRPSTPLDCIKFICKDLWIRVFRKQIDNLKTNHRGTFVLTDNRFHPLARMSVDRKLGPRGVDDAVAKAQAFLWFPCGIIRGALSGLGMNVTVHAESTDLPVATFQIRTVGAKP